MLSLNIHHKNYLLYCNILSLLIIITYSIHIVSTTVYMYLLSSITAVSLYDAPAPPNSIIQLVVGVTLHTERE